MENIQTLQDVVDIVKKQQQQIDSIITLLSKIEKDGTCLLTSQDDDFTRFVKLYYGDEVKEFNSFKDAPKLSLDEFISLSSRQDIIKVFTLLKSTGKKSDMLLFRNVLDILFFLDFDKVHTAMEAINWTWQSSGNTVPSVDEIINVLCGCIKTSIEEYLKTGEMWFCETGGWRAELYEDEDDDQRVKISAEFDLVKWEP